MYVVCSANPIGLSGKFMLIFDRWRKDRSELERLKTNDMRTNCKRRYTSGILGKKFDCDTLIFISFISL